MRKLVVSPSRIETFRCFIDEEYNGVITQDQVIQDIRGERKFTPKIDFGSAFHAIIEHGTESFESFEDGRGKWYVVPVQGPDGDVPYDIHESEITEALKYRNRYSQNVYEPKINAKIQIGNDLVIVAMRIDALNGLCVHEQKTTSRPSGLHDKYYKSIQWKMYALFTQCHFVQYNIFPYKEPSRNRQHHDVSYFRFRLFPYPELENDVKMWIQRYIEFVDRHELTSFITSKY